MSEQKMFSIEEAAQMLDMSEAMLYSGIEQRVIATSDGTITKETIDLFRATTGFYLDVLVNREMNNENCDE